MNPSTTPALQVQGLSFGFAGQPLLFTQWSTDFPAGLSLLVGADGAGKTSALRLLAGELLPQAGRIVRHGVEEGGVFWRDPRAPWPPALMPLAWAQEMAVRYPRWSHEAWSAHVQGFGLEPHLPKAMHQLSAGSQRKVLLAGALASGAALTLLDEPVAALDKPSITYLQQALAREARAPRWPGRMVIVAHYDTLGDLPWQHTVALAQ